ncbi:MAG: trypsin-like peptidase domain-containing protein [Patescibacteria group bacterium]
MARFLKAFFSFSVCLIGLCALTLESPNVVLAKDGSCDSKVIIDDAKNGIVRVKNVFDPMESSGGAGIIIDPKGYILTNRHIIASADKARKKRVLVILKNGKRLVGEVLKVDSKEDLALIKVDPRQCELCEKHSFIFGDSDLLRVATKIYTIGHPFDFLWTVSHGMIAALPRDFSGKFSSQESTMIQTDTVSNPGNSGGILITECGDFVGVNTLMVGSVHQGHSGIGFAIPSNVAKKFFREALSENIKTKKEIQSPWLGIKVKELAYDEFQRLAQRNGSITLNSLLIVGVSDKSSAEKANLKVGDVVVRANDKAFFQGAIDFAQYVNSRAIGDVIVLHIVKKDYGVLRMVSIGIEETPSELDIKTEDPPPTENPTPSLGISFYMLALEPEVLQHAMEINPVAQAHHFMIQDVFFGTPAEKADLRKGDIIIAYDGKKTGNIEVFLEHIFLKKEKNEDVLLIILRGKTTLRISVMLK